MATAQVQKANSSLWFSSSTTAAATFVTQNTVAAALYWLAVFWSDTTRTISSIADTESNTWAAIGSPIVDAGNNFSLQLAYAKNVAGGSKPTVTVTFSGATSNRDVAIHEVSGADTTSPLDGHTNGANVTGSGANSLSTAAFTTTANGDYLAAAMGSPPQSNQTVSAGTGYTLQVSDNAHAEMFASESQIQTTASASTVGVFGSSGFAGAIVTAASFLAAGGGPSVPTYPQLERGIRGLTRGLRGGLARSFVRRDRIFVPAYAVVGDLKVAA